jgi:hypothetical protein
VGDELTGQTAPLVECHSGYAYAERPVALRWESQRVEIELVEAEWRVPGGKRFRVRASDGRTFELFYDELSDAWQVNSA